MIGNRPKAAQSLLPVLVKKLRPQTMNGMQSSGDWLGPNLKRILKDSSYVEE